MSLFKNLVKESEKPKNEKSYKNKHDKEQTQDDEEDKKRPGLIIKSATDLQRLKLEKLMRNAEKPVIIPEPRREKDYMQMVPTFVRNVMGSSAGAGSGEFHVYRHLRRKEYARQKTIQAKSVKEKLDDEFQSQLDTNRRAAEEKTAKKRAKRLKKKERAKRPRQQNVNVQEPNLEESTDESEHDEEEVTVHTEDNPPIETQQDENASTVEIAKGSQLADAIENVEEKPDSEATSEVCEPSIAPTKCCVQLKDSIKNAEENPDLEAPSDGCEPSITSTKCNQIIDTIKNVAENSDLEVPAAVCEPVVAPTECNQLTDTITNVEEEKPNSEAPSAAACEPLIGPTLKEGAPLDATTVSSDSTANMLE